MCAYNPTNGDYKAWKIERGAYKLILIDDLLIVSCGSSKARVIVYNVKDFLASSDTYPKIVNKFSGDAGC